MIDRFSESPAPAPAKPISAARQVLDGIRADLVPLMRMHNPWWDDDLDGVLDHGPHPKWLESDLPLTASAADHEHWDEVWASRRAIRVLGDELYTQLYRGDVVAAMCSVRACIAACRGAGLRERFEDLEDRLWLFAHQQWVGLQRKLPPLLEHYERAGSAMTEAMLLDSSLEERVEA